MADKKVVVGSDITAQQMKEFWNQVALSKINRRNLQSFLEKGFFGQKLGIIQLEKENFRVDSTGGWRQFTNNQGIICLQNPEEDVWEYVGGVPNELVGQQLFAHWAMMRETQKVGKKVPTDEEWTSLIQNPDRDGDGELKKEAEQFNLKSVVSGNRNTNGAFYDLSSNAYFWSSSVSGGDAWSRLLRSGSATVTRYASSQAFGFSVRCLVN